MKTDRTKITRLAKRGSYDRDTINGILDEGLVCMVACSVNDRPIVIPTGYCRVDGELYIHGSVGSHFYGELARGAEACICVTHLDGLVLARSAFHHSMNYRSVVLFSQGRLVEDESEKIRALRAFTESVCPGRWDDVRQPTAGEMKQTMLIAFTIDEASAKIRRGDPVDDDEDYALNIWAGVLPLRQVATQPVPDGKLGDGIPVPAYLREYYESRKS